MFCIWTWVVLGFWEFILFLLLVNVFCILGWLFFWIFGGVLFFFLCWLIVGIDIKIFFLFGLFIGDEGEVICWFLLGFIFFGDIMYLIFCGVLGLDFFLLFSGDFVRFGLWNRWLLFWNLFGIEWFLNLNLWIFLVELLFFILRRGENIILLLSFLLFLLFCLGDWFILKNFVVGELFLELFWFMFWDLYIFFFLVVMYGVWGWFFWGVEIDLFLFIFLFFFVLFKVEKFSWLIGLKIIDFLFVVFWGRKLLLVLNVGFFFGLDLRYFKFDLVWIFLMLICVKLNFFLIFRVVLFIINGLVCIKFIGFFDCLLLLL